MVCWCPEGSTAQVLALLADVYATYSGTRKTASHKNQIGLVKVRLTVLPPCMFWLIL